MASTGVQIDWRAMNSADVVASMRQSLQTKKKPMFATGVTAKAASAPLVAPAGLAAATPDSVTVKSGKFKSAVAAAGKPGIYAMAAALLIIAGVSSVWKANVAFAPEMYGADGLVPAVEAFADGKNYAVFDLNLNIRRLRELQVARFEATPETVLIGASHWQEAHADLMKSRRMYNGHIHRDYWEDLLGVVEVYARHKRLPRQMIISIRDKQFTPVELRKDFLWEPGIPNYQAMATYLGLPILGGWRTLPLQRIRERLSLAMLFNNVTRWYNADERPHADQRTKFQSLDTLLPDGSIKWSDQHMAIFTPDRARREALAFADLNRNNPPVIDPRGVEAFDRLLTFLADNGTEVTLVHPPFNPIYFEHVKGGTYFSGLDKVRKVTADLAAKHGLKIIGDFDPAKVGCTADQYIDAEHANPSCLVHIFKQFDDLNATPAPAAAAGQS